MENFSRSHLHPQPRGIIWLYPSHAMLDYGGYMLARRSRWRRGLDGPLRQPLAATVAAFRNSKSSLQGACARACPQSANLASGVRRQLLIDRQSFSPRRGVSIGCDGQLHSGGDSKRREVARKRLRCNRLDGENLSMASGRGGSLRLPFLHSDLGFHAYGAVLHKDSTLLAIQLSA